MKEKRKTFYKTMFRYWTREKLKPFLIKLLIVSLVVVVGFFAFVWLMAYLLACGEAAGLGQGLRV